MTDIDHFWNFGEMLQATHGRLANALHIVEAIDDPHPGPDLISVACAISDAIDLVEVLILCRRISE